jgi:hypothetical protein
MLVVLVLSILSDTLIQRPSSFLRAFPPHPAIQETSYDIGFNSYYIAGVSENSLYLGNYTAPLHLLVFNSTLTDSQHVKISIPNIERETFWSVRVKIDSPYFYVADGARPRIYSGGINTWHGNRTPYDSAYFVDFVPINSRSFAIRSLSSESNEYVLGKESIRSPHVQLKPGLLEKQIDGQFCVDGMMHYDKKTSRLVYIYFYRNQFVVMDSSLNLKFRGRTIDTTRVAKIKIATISANHSKTMAAPPLLVNKLSCIYDKWLFINSDLMAKNESHKVFDKVSVIDVYNLATKQYAFSFYLSHYTHRKVKDFRVWNNKLFALFDHFVVVFDLLPKYFEE